MFYTENWTQTGIQLEAATFTGVDYWNKRLSIVTIISVLQMFIVPLSCSLVSTGLTSWFKKLLLTLVIELIKRLNNLRGFLQMACLCTLNVKKVEKNDLVPPAEQQTAVVIMPELHHPASHNAALPHQLCSGKPKEKNRSIGCKHVLWTQWTVGQHNINCCNYTQRLVAT